MEHAGTVQSEPSEVSHMLTPVTMKKQNGGCFCKWKRPLTTAACPLTSPETCLHVSNQTGKREKNHTVQDQLPSQSHSRSGVPVAHACNPSYSEGRDQEDCDLMPA
jgi:hypothetical protein